MNDNGAIIRTMKLLTLKIGVRAHGIDYLIENGLPENIINAYAESYNKQLTEAAAKLLGIDAQIMTDMSDTPEKERIMLEISTRASIGRIERFMKSDYNLACNTIVNRYTGDKPDDKRASIEEIEILALISQYFFAIHPEFDPLDKGNLGDAEITELLSLIDKAMALMSDDTNMTLLEAICSALGFDKAAFTEQPTKPVLLSSIIPANHIIPNNKLANTLTDDIIDIGSFDLDVGGKGKNAVTNVCVLTYEGDDVKLTGRQSYTEYDRNVYDSVTSLFVYGDETHIMTPAMVYRAMVFMTETETPSAQQIGAVTRSLDKMRFIRARINCTEELKRRGAKIDGDQITSGIIDTYLLAAETTEVEAGGKTVKAYHIIKTPILYEYARLLGQVLTVPAALLDVKVDGQRLKNTEPRIAIKGYLLRRIKGMQGKNRLNNDNISLESYDKDGKHHVGLYELAGEENASRAVKQRIRDYAEDVLRYWISEKFIAGYELIRESGSARAVKSIRIIL